MSKRVGYLTFGRDDFGYGMAVCLRELSGLETYRVTPKTAPCVDTLLFSCFWWEHLYFLADFVRKAGVRKCIMNRPRIIVGGYNTFNPVPFLAYADAVWVGDAEGAFGEWFRNGKCSEHVYDAPTQQRVVYHHADKIIPITHVTGQISRVEIARGCRYKCKFCLVAHIKPYREASVSDIVTAIRKIGTKRASLFAPDTTAHSQRRRIDLECSIRQIVRVDTDSRIDDVHLRGSSQASRPHIGIEGISERLRFSVGKRFSDDFLIERIERLIDAGVSGIMAYFILGLPGEDDSDWESFEAFLKRLGNVKGAEKFTFELTPNTFNANPHTPIENAPVNWDVDYYSRWQGLFSWHGNRHASGAGGDMSREEWIKTRPWKMNIMAWSRIYTPAMRVLTMLALRAGHEFAEIEEKLTRDRMIRVQSGRVVCNSIDGLLRALEGYGGVDRYCGIPREMPWKVVEIPKLSPSLQQSNTKTSAISTT